MTTYSIDGYSADGYFATDSSPSRFSLDASNPATASIVNGLNLARWVAIEGSSKTDKTAMLLANYGDGYSQRASDGINNKKDRWTLTFAPLGVYDWQALLNFYDTSINPTTAVGVTKWFYYTAMGDSSPKKWTIDKDTWNPTPLNQSLWSVTFSITQCFDAGN